MIEVFYTVGDETITTTSLQEKGSWIRLTEPTKEELLRVSAETGVLLEFLEAPLDDEERPRIEVEDGQVLMIVNIPIVVQNGTVKYDTLPLGIIVTENHIITVCLEENAVINDLVAGRLKSFYTYKKTRLTLQILYKTATYFLKYLKEIDRKSNEIEQALHGSMQNEELIRLLNLEKSLVYFTTSLRSNEIVMKKLLRTKVLKMYAEDEDLLEDVITENAQALEMSEVYSNITSGMMDAFASIISNNLNIVMKFLTSITIILAVPTMVASFFGMNVPLPFQNSPHGFLITIVISLFLAMVAVLAMARKEMF
ncbi:magnesium transporter CorA family protein [Zhaonella formicivorans]|uniref:magnesium transporter CorA family protein n=1 Tax=Zhaonella formicivorans TaxID=2528593 RepID=UPI0010DFF5CC|nr:magnesium transporter CorA family protein [Zhaonella formicivorans]